ncbi:hypothetical protein PVAND_016241 [Polypedilum vanderplanki]|uniref:Uncharacterized protein n=1 Tax=Polypedilum vanderplanki TaxID=319348 RepID=A0A9J6BFM0_POLVA|nr:hypothetical protein PVAND_016241 [Polypedilum vanderplanki]
MNFSMLFAILTLFKIFKFSNTFTIRCSYEIKNLTTGFVYCCSATDFPSSSGIAVTNITGTHQDEKDNKDVTCLYIYGRWSLSFFPSNFGNFFPNIKFLVIYDTSIQTLYGNEINEFPKIQDFRLFNSNLTTISSRLFEETPKMAFVFFGNTMIERVGYNLFTPLNVTQLKWIYFQGNRCINRIASDYDITEIISLIYELRLQCPYTNEGQTTTTTRPTTTTIRTTTTTSRPTTTTSRPTTTTSVTTTSIKNLVCIDESFEDFVCYLKNTMIEIQENLETKDEKIQKIDLNLNSTRVDLKKVNEKTEDLENELTILKQKLQAKDEIINKMDTNLNATKSELYQVRDDLIQTNNKLDRVNERTTALQNDLTQANEKLNKSNERIEEVELELKASREELNDVKSRMQSLELEVLRLTTNPCACK